MKFPNITDTMAGKGLIRSWPDQQTILRWLSGVLPLLLVLAAWRIRFVQDDAFISFRYAENWARGFGPVWNFGERVEGYTNFLWTALLAMGFKLGIEPITLTYLMGLACFLVSLMCVRSILMRLAGPGAALLAVLLVGTNYSFLAFATGGLETSMQAALAMLLLVLCLPTLCSTTLGASPGPSTVRPSVMPPKHRVDPLKPELADRIDSSTERSPGTGRLLLLSIVGALNVLGRLDSTIFVAIVFGAMVLHVARLRAGAGRRSMLMALLGPAAAVVTIWCLWRVAYYGDLLPNTFYVKVGGLDGVKMGLVYTWTFLTEYTLWPPLVMAGLCLAGNLAYFTHWERIAAVITVAWFIYVSLVGGDFIEFRFFVPVLPVVIVLLTSVAWRARLPQLVTLAAAGSLLVSSAAHSVLFRGNVRLESVSSLERHLFHPSQNWVGIGKRLAREFGAGGHVKIAITAAGAIPFYSKLPALDMYGLCDSWIARNGLRTTLKPGHTRLVPISYLLQRGTNLMIAHPEVITTQTARQWTAERFRENFATAWVLDPSGPREPPSGSQGLLMPIDEDHVIAIYYLIPSVEVDAVIQQNRWRTVPLG